MQKECLEVDVGGQDHFLVLGCGLFRARPVPDEMETDTDQLLNFVGDIVQGGRQLGLSRGEGAQKQVPYCGAAGGIVAPPNGNLTGLSRLLIRLLARYLTRTNSHIPAC